MKFGLFFRWNILGLLVVVFFLALGLRLWHFPGNIYFGFDQAVHAFNSQRAIVERDIILQGPGTDIPGVFHGPLYYYLIGPIYLLSQGSPYLPQLFLLVANALGIFLVYQLAAHLFDRRVGLISALIFAVSFEQYQYAYYLSNPSLGVISFLIFYLGLGQYVFGQGNSDGQQSLLGRVLVWIQSKRGKSISVSSVQRNRHLRGLWLVALGLATAIHFEFFLAYLFLVAVGWIIVSTKLKLPQSKKKPSLKNLVLSWRNQTQRLLKANASLLVHLVGSTGLLVLLLSNFIAAEIKYRGRMIRTLMKMALAGQGGDRFPSASEFFDLLLQKFTQLVYLNIFGLNFYLALVSMLALVVFLLLIKKSKQHWFLLSGILAPLLLYVTDSVSNQYFHMHMGTGVLLIILVVSLLVRVRSQVVVMLCVCLIVGGNLLLFKGYGDKSLAWGMLIAQDGMIWRDIEEVVAFTYRESQGDPFEIKVQTTWAYIYDQLGEKEYGYKPYSFYDDVPGLPGSLPKADAETQVCYRYLISEPMTAIAPWFEEEFWSESDVITIKSKSFGSLRVEQRVKEECLVEELGSGEDSER